MLGHSERQRFPADSSFSYIQDTSTLFGRIEPIIRCQLGCVYPGVKKSHLKATEQGFSEDASFSDDPAAPSGSCIHGAQCGFLGLMGSLW
ncbi:hypothetical protein XENORESO_000197 [Xenotaenia resolanae]|uniref:Uncharacterized protein n=2 Tax=Goodeidae TaxID=28758 RepID=A0ABV0WQL6_9TELE